MIKIIKSVVPVILCVGMVFSCVSPYAKAAVSISCASSIKVGQIINVKSSSGASFSVSDSKYASITPDGRLIGKRPGKVTIIAKPKSANTAKKTITVKAKAYKPTLPVTVDELEIINQKTDKSADYESGYAYSFRIKNNSSSKLKKAVITYEVSYTKNDETEAVSGEALGVESGQRISKTISVKMGEISPNSSSDITEGMGAEDISSIRLISIKAYSGKALHTYNAGTKKYSFGWGVKDTVKPKFSGQQKSGSGFDGVASLTVYSDKRSGFNYKRFIKVSDDRSPNVSLKVDKSHINWEKTGMYKVYFTAEDKAGNTAKTWSYINVIVPGDAEKMADSILSSITKNSWSDTKKARAIYKYVRANCSYVDSGTHSDYRRAAGLGFMYRSGDCFTYYSMSRVLLGRAGIPNLMIRRYPYVVGHQHWWNLVYVQGGWYHFDTTPRSGGGVFCLNTDAQLRAYSSGNTFAFKSSLYPKRATKVISATPSHN